MYRDPAIPYFVKGSVSQSFLGSVHNERLDAAAHGVFLEWRQDLEDRLRDEKLHPALESHLAKYRKLIPGVALINHLAEYGSGDVTEAPMLKAMAMAGKTAITNARNRP